MPWKEVTIMSQRRAFVELAGTAGANMRELCRRFGISPPTGYKWLTRYREGGVPVLQDQSRRPQRSPAQTADTMEADRLLGRYGCPECQASVHLSPWTMEPISEQMAMGRAWAE